MIRKVGLIERGGAACAPRLLAPVVGIAHSKM
jgi:hypothetical protein